MAAESSSAQPASMASSADAANPSSQNLRIYETIRRVYFSLDSHAVQPNSFGFDMAREDFVRSSAAEQQKFIREEKEKTSERLTHICRDIKNRADVLILKCQKRYLKTLEGVYPPVELSRIKQQHTELCSHLSRVDSIKLVGFNDFDDWEKLEAAIEKALSADEKLASTTWINIERFDKYRNDLLRYYITSVSLFISFIVFMLVNLPKAYETVASGLALLSAKGPQLPH